MFAVLVAIAALAPPSPPQSAAPRCPDPIVHRAAAPIGRATPLDRQPPASLYLAVERRIDKCLAPVIVRTAAGDRLR